MTPLQRYQQDLAAGFIPDIAQAQAILHLQKLYEVLVAKPSLLQLFKRRVPRGLYLWGGVGRGKTYLMDIFFESLPFQAKKRMHFHRFMQRVHHDLQALLGEKNPLKKIAGQWARETKILCFDEFFVEDITDATLLAGLLQALLKENIVLVATSNVAPQNLYRKGILRERFLPAITLIEKNTEIIAIEGGVDYRLRTLTAAPIYEVGDNKRPMLEVLFAKLAVGEIESDILLEVYDRKIKAIKAADNIVWFNFKELCETARSQYDYLELAAVYAIIMIEEVPLFTAEKEDAARRFIHLVDAFYDNNIKLILGAAALPEVLYQGHRFTFEFQRTQSRLREMQTVEYLSRGHKSLLTQVYT